MPYIPVAPKRLKKACERSGFTAIDEDDDSWLMASEENDEPFAIPKKGSRVAPEPFNVAISRCPNLIRDLTSEMGVQQAPASPAPKRSKRK